MAKLVLLLVFVCFQFSRSEDLSAIEQVKLDLDEVPFNNQTAPDIEVLDGSDEDQWNPGPKFNHDWLNEKLPSSENKTENKTQSLLEKLVELAELIAEYSEDSFEWDDDLYDDYDDEDYWGSSSTDWDTSKDWSYTAEYKESVKGKNGKEYIYNSIISLLKPEIAKGDKIGHSLSNGKLHPVKRFTSV